MTKVTALIQARTSSSRFPGKVLAELAGIPMIQFMVGRVRRARKVDQIMVVTSTDPSDDILVETLAAAGIEYFRGPLDDVLSRFVLAAKYKPADAYVRLTGDCPLVDPGLVDAVVSGLLDNAVDYASNVEPPSFADGLDVEAFTAKALKAADMRASFGPEREHVTLWMRGVDSEFKRHNVSALVDSSHLRFTVDYPDDLEVVRKIVASVSGHKEDFDHFDVLRYLDANRMITEHNVHRRNEALSGQP